ncbi:MAG: hypothetical protein HY364_02530 [Candidatus Aenigmarchaeota archaeon]|nr:hypothetical protein [Candidatus Aenigmarchaeota archaeon]
MKAAIVALFLIHVSFASVITPFSSPDNMEKIVGGFLQESESPLVAVYTFTNPAIAWALAGKNATILVEKAPAGGIPDRSILCFLQDSGSRVLLYDGPYRFMHAKYAVSGNRSLILSENFGSFKARGWGAIIEDEHIASNLTSMFNEDSMHAVPFVCQMNYTFHESSVARETMPSYHGNATIVAAPGATQDIVSFLSSAKERLWIQQAYIYRKWSHGQNPFIEAIESSPAKKKIMMDGSWFNIDKNDRNSNYYTDQYMKSLGIASKISDFEIHNKGVVADSTALVSSINWNENSPENNREVGVLVTGEAAKYFAARFEEDWHKTEIPFSALAVFIFSLGIVKLWIILRNRKKYSAKLRSATE